MVTLGSNEEKSENSEITVVLKSSSLDLIATETTEILTNQRNLPPKMYLSATRDVFLLEHFSSGEKIDSKIELDIKFEQITNYTDFFLDIYVPLTYNGRKVFTIEQMETVSKFHFSACD